MSAALRRLPLAAFLVLSAASAVQAQPSYSCSATLTATEQAICDDAQLARLDTAMASVYGVLVADISSRPQPETARASVRRAQLDWRSRRDTCATDAACLRRSYLDQIQHLTRQLNGGHASAGSTGSVTVDPHGNMTRIHADGGVVRRDRQGSVRMFAPDGTELDVSEPMVQAPYSGLPPLPETHMRLEHWITRELDIILKNLLSDDEFVAYRTTEAGKAAYGLIEWKFRSIHFLTAGN